MKRMILALLLIPPSLFVQWGWDKPPSFFEEFSSSILNVLFKEDELSVYRHITKRS